MSYNLELNNLKNPRFNTWISKIVPQDRYLNFGVSRIMDGSGTVHNIVT